jgi:hypothetical protein
MGNRLALALLAAIAGQPDAVGCEPRHADRFQPSLTPVHNYAPPPPVVRVVRVARGTAAPGFSCEDAGQLELAVSVPTSSLRSINEFGVYFRVVSGQQPDVIFPEGPVIGPVQDGVMTLYFPWLDGAPSTHTVINLVVEAFFVSNDLRIGTSAIFEVKG